MKWLMIVLTILFISATPAYSLDYLDQQNLIDNIIKSFDEEPQNWFIANNFILYAKNPKNLKKASEELYPEHSTASIIVIDFYFNRPRGYSYIQFEKPEFYDEYLNPDDKDYKKFERAIKIQMYKRLKSEVGIEAEVNIKQRVEVPKIEKEKPPKKSGYL